MHAINRGLSVKCNHMNAVKLFRCYFLTVLNVDVRHHLCCRAKHVHSQIFVSKNILALPKYLMGHVCLEDDVIVKEIILVSN